LIPRPTIPTIFLAVWQPPDVEPPCPGEDLGEHAPHPEAARDRLRAPAMVQPAIDLLPFGFPARTAPSANASRTSPMSAAKRSRRSRMASRKALSAATSFRKGRMFFTPAGARWSGRSAWPLMARVLSHIASRRVAARRWRARRPVMCAVPTASAGIQRAEVGPRWQREVRTRSNVVSTYAAASAGQRRPRSLETVAGVQLPVATPCVLDLPGVQFTGDAA
jgi:hypothetical protein